MAEIETWLDDASRNLSIPIRKLSTEEAAAVYREAHARYVTGEPRAWWMALSQPYAHYDSSETSLNEVLPARVGRVFLIPESDDGPVAYEIDVGHLEAILGDCPFFEYYIVGPDLRWLVAESDHNEFFVCQDSNG